MLEYHAAYYQDPEDEQWIIAEVIDFPGVASQGRTLRSARRMIRDALRSMVEWYLEDGLPLPRPKSRVRDKKALCLEKIRIGVRLAEGVQA